jgi:hypothetical protein
MPTVTECRLMRITGVHQPRQQHAHHGGDPPVIATVVGAGYRIP